MIPRACAPSDDRDDGKDSRAMDATATAVGRDAGEDDRGVMRGEGLNADVAAIPEASSSEKRETAGRDGREAKRARTDGENDAEARAVGDANDGKSDEERARKPPKWLGVKVQNVPSTLLDETERKLRRPMVDKMEMYRLLVAHYDLGEIDVDSMSELPSYDDKNWYIKAKKLNEQGDAETKEYVVKVHNGVDSSGVSRGVLAAQERVMMHLLAHGVECPRVVRSKVAMWTTPGPDGTVNLVPAGTPGSTQEHCTRVTFLASNQIAHTLRVMTYLRGKTVVQVPMPHPVEFVHRQGLFVGQICHALSKWPTPNELEILQKTTFADSFAVPYVQQCAMCWKVLAASSRLWDLRHFMDVQHFLTDLVVRRLFEDDTRIMMCSTVFSAFKHLVLPVADKLRVGILHNDLNEQNMIALDSGPDPVKFPAASRFACIDFGDVVVSWRINEVAIALAYCALDKEDPIRDMSIMLAGIQNVFPLTPSEMRILPCLIAARLVTSLVMGMYSYHMQIVSESDNAETTTAPKPKGNEYVLTTQKSAWTALTHVLTVGAEAMFKRFIIDAYSESPTTAAPS